MVWKIGRNKVGVGSGGSGSGSPSSIQKRKVPKINLNYKGNKETCLGRNNTNNNVQPNTTIIKEEGCTPLELVPKKRGNEIAIVACGNFWSPQQRMQKVCDIQKQ